jgi:hypothetical protein
MPIEDKYRRKPSTSRIATTSKQASQQAGKGY